MSTKADRRGRAQRVILPITVQVRQSDGSVVQQKVDADVRRKAPRVRARMDQRETDALREMGFDPDAPWNEDVGCK